jgi:hypothetical protein
MAEQAAVWYHIVPSPLWTSWRIDTWDRASTASALADCPGLTLGFGMAHS